LDVFSERWLTQGARDPDHLPVLFKDDSLQQEVVMASMTISQWMDSACAAWGDKTALTFLRKGRVETVLTFARLNDEINAYAEFLGCQDVEKGDRVILLLQKSLNAAIAHLAIQRIGGVTVPLNPGFKSSEMEYLLNDAQARLVLCDAGRRDWILKIDACAQVLELPNHLPYAAIASGRRSEGATDDPNIGSDDPGLIIYTSGTTGNPKGAVLTQQNLTHDAATIISAWEITQTDVLCHALPLFHIHGLSFALHTALLSGAHVILLDTFDPGTVLEVLSSKKGGAACTMFMAVPAMYSKLMDRLEADSGSTPPDFSHLRLLTCGSAPLLPREFERIEALFGQAPVEREGMSETGMNFSNPLHGRRVPGSIGIPLPGVKVRIVDPHSLDDVQPGEVGEIWLQSPAITPGYWEKPEETREAFESRWFRTGDLGKKDADGYYYLTDRIKHIIITGGENVSAKEVETVINSIDGVVESSVVGLPDRTWGERVVAAIVLQPEVRLDTEEVRAVCKTHLHDWKCPKEIAFVEALPRNTMGKVLKEEVKNLFNIG
jgi:malonyl-CoA/methylmalonyl-CoA synthetase